MPMPAPDLTRFLTPGGPYPFPLDGVEARVRLLPAVPLSLPSGRVVALEPFMAGGEDEEEMAFGEQVKPGVYPVELSEIDLIDGTGRVIDTRTATARLVIREEPVVRWELAVTAGQDPKELDDDSYFGYPVDGGTGCFLDATTYRALHTEEDFAERVLDAMYADAATTPGGGDRTPDPLTLAVGNDPTAVVAFSTGWGDGVYATWIGRTANDEVACFLTDFVDLDEDDADDDGAADADGGRDD
ncbi:DUF4241 domain-containing protein [Streptomyces sp. NPDC008150]|uniref:DUF4241 domain-containing protein n=1 Tax=Streptomyces sp. NPDC008150 TaxID=3364816 RepID=UPI0036E45B97